MHRTGRELAQLKQAQFKVGEKRRLLTVNAAFTHSRLSSTLIGGPLFKVIKYEQSDGKSFEKELDSATCSQVSVSHRKSISQQMRKERRLRLTRMLLETSGQTRETGPDRLSVSPAIRCVSCGTWGSCLQGGEEGNPRQDQRRDSILSTDAKLRHMLREYESQVILC